MKILLDSGHGYDTAGKRSPDGKLLEWSYTRFLTQEIFSGLRRCGLDPVLLVPESRDVPLRERVRRANRIWKETGGQALLVSVHLNAAGDGSDWMRASGWSCYTSVGKTRADDLAESLCDAASTILAGRRMRFHLTDGDRDQEANFYLLRKTACPAVLTENLFMDNRDDYAFLLSDEGISAIVALHISGIVNYIQSINP